MTGVYHHVHLFCCWNGVSLTFGLSWPLILIFSVSASWVVHSASTCPFSRHHFSVGKTDKCIRQRLVLSWQRSRVAKKREHLMGLATEQLRCDWMWERTRTSLAMTLSELGWTLNSSFRQPGICCWQPSNGCMTFLWPWVKSQRSL
jgi:hypothetical protein